VAAFVFVRCHAVQKNGVNAAVEQQDFNAACSGGVAEHYGVNAVRHRSADVLYGTARAQDDEGGFFCRHLDRTKNERCFLLFGVVHMVSSISLVRGAENKNASAPTDVDAEAIKLGIYDLYHGSTLLLGQKENGRLIRSIARSDEPLPR
jgi:hypothetical protein